MRKIPGILISTFTAGDYRAINPVDSVIYCDPPYFGTTPYKGERFDHGEFYDYLDRMAAHGNAVFYSEFTVPDRPNHEIVLEIPRATSIRRSSGEAVNDLLIRVRPRV